MDLWGLAPVSSNANLYYLNIIDVCTRYTWIYFLNKKSDVAAIFPQIHKSIENQLGHTVKAIQTDGYGEFKALAYYLVEYGINHRFTCPCTYEQNGIVERKHRHVVKIGIDLDKTSILVNTVLE